MSKKKNKFWIVFLIILIISASYVLAKIGGAVAETKPLEQITAESGDNLQQDADQDKKPVEAFPFGENKESVNAALFKLIGALIIVVAAIYGFLYLLKKMMGSGFSGNRKTRHIEVIETTYIAQKKSISLVRFGGRSVLVGVGDSGINVLAELTPEETSRLVAETATESKNESIGFKGLLDNARTRFSNFSLKETIGISQAESKRPETA